MNKHKEAIIFTKEDGQNKFLVTSKSNDVDLLIKISKNELKYFKKVLGHSPLNLYAFYDGIELKILDY